MENQDKGAGPTYWQPAYPASGFGSIAEAKGYMNGLGPRYTDTGQCPYCMRGSLMRRGIGPARPKRLIICAPARSAKSCRHAPSPPH